MDLSAPQEGQLRYTRREVLQKAGAAFALAALSGIYWMKPAHAAYSRPITITRGGAYRGNWRSTNRNVPAVTIATPDPVIIEQSSIEATGLNITSSVAGVDLTVRNTNLYGRNPNVWGVSKNYAMYFDDVKKLRVENNFFRGTPGVKCHRYSGTASQTIKILRNRAKNIDGRISNGNGGYRSVYGNIAQFFQCDKVRNMVGMEIAWNEVINIPYKSMVEDNINIYLSSGTPESPIDIHDNYIEGAWQTDPLSSEYYGGGILAGDGIASTPEEAPHHIHAHHNQVVGCTNHHIAIANGHDIQLYANRAAEKGKLDAAYGGGIKRATNIGCYVWNAQSQPAPIWGNNKAYDNKLGVCRIISPHGNDQRGDWWLPDCKWHSENIALPDPINKTLEDAEFTRWQQKLSANGVSVGPA
jgi:hypothetical protein